MQIFSEENFDNLVVPRTWESLIDLINQFWQIQIQDINVSTKKLPKDQQEKLLDLNEQILTESKSLLEKNSLNDFDQSHFNTLLAKSMIALSYMKYGSGVSEKILDTAHSKTLDFYHLDFDSYQGDDNSVQKLVAGILGNDSKAQELVNEKMEARLIDAQRKNRILNSLRDHFKLWTDDPDHQDGVQKIFQEFFPNSGFKSEQIKLVATGTCLYFSVPFDEKKAIPTGSIYESSAPDEKEQMEQFITKLTKFKHKFFAHFPVFGFFKGSDVSKNILENIAKSTDYPIEMIQEELTPCVTILPLEAIDQYIVHDIYGHSWQASIMDFEKLYQGIADYNDPIHLSESSSRLSGKKFGDCFKVDGNKVTFSKDDFYQFALAEILERLPIALSPVIAEMAADVIEYKFIDEQPELEELMPSSSLFKHFPTKIDLSLKDVRFYFLQATKVFRFWAKKDDWQKVTIEQLAALGASNEAAKVAVKKGVQYWKELEETTFSTNFNFQITDSGIEITPFTGLMLNFVGMHSSFIDTYNQLKNHKPKDLPLKSYVELMLFMKSFFYEADIYKNFWRIDEFLTHRFLPYALETREI